jgi:hypothetical protein
MLRTAMGRKPTKAEKRTLRRGGAVTLDHALLQSGSTTEPMTVTLREATRLSGLSRSTLYLLASAGKIIFRKANSRVLVDYASLKAAVAGLPRAAVNIGGRGLT